MILLSDSERDMPIKSISPSFPSSNLYSSWGVTSPDKITFASDHPNEFELEYHSTSPVL